MHWPGNNIGVAGAEALVPALKEMTALEELHLYREFACNRVGSRYRGCVTLHDHDSPANAWHVC